MVRGILSLVGLGLAVGIFLLYTQPTYLGVQSKRAEIERYNQALDKAAELQQLKQSLLSRYNAFDPNDIDRLHKLLPDHVDNVRLVLDLDNLAGKHGMALQNVVISSPEDAEAAKGAVGTVGASKQKYGSLMLKFTTHSVYSNFVTFIEDLEASLRIVDLVALSLSQDDGSVIAGRKAPGSEPTYRYDITLKTYWLR